MDALRHGSLTPEFLRAAGFIILANLPFWILSEYFFVLRPLVNIDVVLALLVWMVSPVAGAACLVAVWTVEGLQSLSLVFHFSSPVEFAKSVRFAGDLRWADFVSASGLAVSAGLTLAVAVMWLLHRRWRPSAAPVLLCALMVLLIDVINGSGIAPLFGRDRFLIPINLAGSPTMNLAAVTVQSAQRGSRPLRPIPGPSASDDIAAWTSTNSGNVLVVIVESWGEHRSPAMQDWLIARLTGESILRRWQVRTDKTRFEGSTTAGEMRVLCALSGHYGRLTKDAAGRCLPARLRADGYSTYGLHGFTGSMFDRTKWWPMIGLEHRIFGESMPSGSAKCGGAFRGICDTSMVDRAADLLAGQKRFVYLLTLNTHLPIAPMELPPDLEQLCRTHAVEPAPCQLTAQLGSLFEHIRNTLLRLQVAPLVTIVGDHSPPFLVQSTRAQYSSETVPRIVMVPR